MPSDTGRKEKMPWPPRLWAAAFSRIGMLRTKAGTVGRNVCGSGVVLDIFLTATDFFTGGPFFVSSSSQ